MTIAIYMEGGNRRQTKAALRRGMGTFLVDIKNACKRRGWKWKLVCCGRRDAAFHAYRRSCLPSAKETAVLLVDAETGVGSASPATHLKQRDNWPLDPRDDERFHLMVQTMETWIVADLDALTGYYGQGFLENAIPRASNLEGVSKAEIARAEACHQGYAEGRVPQNQACIGPSWPY